MSERRIGRIISVDSFRVIVQLDDDLKGLFKSGFHDIYEIARINSYLIIPVGADRIVSIVTRVKIQDETDIEKSSGFITLPKAQRYLVATMIGTIENGESYNQGVYNYPILDNPVWYVTTEDLDKIFDTTNSNKFNLDDDYYLPIGTSPAFSDYQIKINPDKFFAKHAAILGNTGSGKSCTVASIIQSLFNFEFEDKLKLQSAHFIIFDTNGEYKKAFIGDEGQNKYQQKGLVNAIHINKDGLKMPYWFMNFDDFDYLFDPSANTQTPILKRAIGISKNTQVIDGLDVLDRFSEKGIIDLQDYSPEELKKKKSTQAYGNWTYNANNDILGLGNAISPGESAIISEIKTIVTQIGGQIGVQQEANLISQLKEKYQQYISENTNTRISVEKNIDLPIWFSYTDLITTHFDAAIKETEGSGSKIKEFVSTLKLRLQSFYDDERIAGPLILKNPSNFSDSLAKFLAFCLGDYSKIYNSEDLDIFTTYYKSQVVGQNNGYLTENKNSQITIIDMSLLPYEVLETITGLIGRLILDFFARFKPEDRGTMPTAIILEEAQNYIPEKDKTDKPSITKKVFERIAREGRKYGLSLVVSSQRPSELSKTVLSQCNSFIIHRLQNPEDQKYIKQLVSAANEDILQQLPILPQQHAIVMGDGVRTPVQVKINKADPKPNSDNPKFVKKWLTANDNNFPPYKVIAKLWEEGETPT
ncbi:MAG: DUF87 domain-containing protein [Bacteroidota bacterium]|nr:DUF87 domain-containing protein [Bacteroidota bacterium]MDP4257640.1 DUF87 domain-containing protein [Bacteroidota bacterium]